MKITITKGDLKKAQEEMEATGEICSSCLVYQAMKRCGFPVYQVAFTEWRKSSDGDWIDLKDTKEITFAHRTEWPQMVGKTFETVD